MQLAYHPKLAKDGTRAAVWKNPREGEILIRDRETARKYLDAIEKQLRSQMSKHKRAEWLIARAMLYEAIGDRKMMGAASDAYNFTKTATTCHLMAVAHHHFGNLRDAVKFYKLAYKYPHEAGLNIDLAYAQAAWFENNWAESHRVTLGLKKRMVYSAYLPEWDGQPRNDLSIISEGGFGDIIYMARFIPLINEMGIKSTIYLPPYFFDAGLTDLMKRQPWCPDIKFLLETPQHTPAAGFFDLPGHFKVTPETMPLYPAPWKADPERVKKYSHLRSQSEHKPLIGFCWAARSMDAPLVPGGVYRTMLDSDAEKILTETSKDIQFVSLQLGEGEKFGSRLLCPEIKNWDDTAAIIANLDAVVTVDTAVMHVAAAMSKPVWVLLSGASDWKFGIDQNFCIGYPTIRLFRNSDFGYDRAVQAVIEALNQSNLMELFK
jgi:Glycosyltransferase family 9 (heptosyltransferase)